MNKDSKSIAYNPTFADILGPMSPEAFFAEHYDRKLAHIQGGAEKFSNVMSWESLTEILNMSAAWSAKTLQLVIDRDVVRPAAFCETAPNRDGQEVLRPNAEKVMALLRRGASLVANDIDTLTPGLRAVAVALEAAVYGKAQANLYCSWREHQAFGSHFDTHDVYAMHIAGEKLWRIYETRADVPIAHPDFKSYGQEWHDANRGAVAQEILMRPGDLLYIPRGLYHDALATSDGTIHIAFGVTHVIGLDAIDMFTSLAVSDPLFRRNMPHPSEGEAARKEWLAGLGDRLAEFGRDPEALRAIADHQQGFHYERGGFNLPVVPPGRAYRLTAPGLRVEQQNGTWVLTGPKGTVPIPPGLDGPVSWILEQPEFEEKQLVEAFPAMPVSQIEKLLEDLAGMKILAKAG